jgi:hypothetical protein
MRSFKYLFTHALHVNIVDLLLIVNVVKRKKKELPLTNKDDFNLVLNVYSLIIDDGYNAINNLYLPNALSVLCLGRSLAESALAAVHQQA